MTAEERLDAVKRENAARRSEEQRALDTLARHLRWHHEAGGRGLTLEELHAKTSTTRYGTDATRRHLQDLVDAGRAHKVVVDQVAVWRHGVEPLPEVPTTADRVLEAVKAWPTWSELEAAVGVQGYDLGEVVTPLEREKRVVRRTTFRAPGQLAWLPADDAGKALSARELAVLVHLEALPTSTDAVAVLRGEAADPDGWTSVTATREKLGFTHSAWSYTTGNTALGAELRARTLGGPVLERRGATTTARVRLSMWARELLAELRARGLLLLEAPETAPAAAGAAEGLSAPPPPVGETPDVAGDGLVQPSPLDPPRVDTVAAGDAHLSGREGTDEDGVAGGDTPESDTKPTWVQSILDGRDLGETALGLRMENQTFCRALEDWPDVDVEDLDGNSAEVSAAPDAMIYELINPSDPILFEAPNDIIAAAVGIILGGGLYAVEDDAGATVLGIFIGGGSVAWFEERHGSFLAFVAQQRDVVAAALESCTVAKRSEYAALVAALTAGGGDLVAAKTAFNESRRTSLNNICAQASGWAARVRTLETA